MLITFESDWHLAKDLLQNIAQGHSKTMLESEKVSFNEAAKQYMIEFGQLGAKVYTSVKDSGVLLTIRYLCEPRNRRDRTETILEGILETFNQYEEIEFAYSLWRFYNSSQKEHASVSPTGRLREN